MNVFANLLVYQIFDCFTSRFIFLFSIHAKLFHVPLIPHFERGNLETFAPVENAPFETRKNIIILAMPFVTVFHFDNGISVVDGNYGGTDQVATETAKCTRVFIIL